MRPALAVVAVLALAGCAQPEMGTSVTLDSEGNATDETPRTPPAPRDNATRPSDGSPPPSSNGTGPQPAPTSTAPPASWPDLASAPVRPGVQVRADGGQCTANFVFTSPDNTDIYLGLAAHCLYGLEVGSPVDIADGAAKGTVAYSSWFLTGHNAPNSPDGDICTNATDDAECAYNDFALILIDHADKDKVHPAMLHFGGPVALGNSSEIRSLDKVLTYGNSGLRAGVEPASWHEGAVLMTEAPWTTTVYTVTPGVPGDSGSGVLSRDGAAMGVLVTVAVAPFPASNGVSHLDTLLAWAKDRAGIDVRLATWDLLDPGLLPL